MWSSGNNMALMRGGGEGMKMSSSKDRAFISSVYRTRHGEENLGEINMGGDQCPAMNWRVGRNGKNVDKLLRFHYIKYYLFICQIHTVIFELTKYVHKPVMECFEIVQTFDLASDI